MNVHIKADTPLWFIVMLFVFGLISALASLPAWLTVFFLVIGAGLAIAR